MGFLDKLLGRTKETTETAVDEAATTVDKATDAASSTVDDAKEAVGSGADEVKKAADDTTGADSPSGSGPAAA